MSEKNESVAQLQRQSRQTREALTRSVGELRGKVGDVTSELKIRASPQHIKQEIKEYVAEERETLTRSLERKIRENPLQAAAVGAAVAYPLWGLLRSIPMPMYLLGAGVWLAGKQGRNSIARVQAQAEELGEAAKGKASELATATMDAANSGLSRAQDAIAGAGASLSSTAETLTDVARASTHDIRDTLARQTASVSSATTTATEAVTDAAASIKNRATAATAQSSDALAEFVNRNPLLTAGVGLAVGAFIARSLPATDAEDRFFGEHSKALKEKAREAASGGLDLAKDIATEVVGNVATAAAKDTLKKAVDGLAAGAKAVADRGMQTAMSDAAPTSRQ